MEWIASALLVFVLLVALLNYFELFDALDVIAGVLKLFFGLVVLTLAVFTWATRKVTKTKNS